MDPLVSVMMPAKNTGKFISQAIQSIIDQTYPNWELIIVDDKSTDNTRNIAESFAKKDHRIKVYDGNGVGVANTRNKIVELSNGEFIMLMDSDDTSSPTRMEKLLNLATLHKKSYIGSNVHFVDLNLNVKSSSNKPLSNRQIRSGFTRWFNRFTIAPQTVLAHTALYKQHHYNEFIQIMSDWDLVLRICEDHEVFFGNIEEPLYYYRLNDTSMTLNQETRIKFNLLLRYNQINRKHRKTEIRSIKEFDKFIQSNFFAHVTYKFFYTLKKMQHNKVLKRSAAFNT